MKKISAFFLGILIVATLTSCSFFGKEEEKKEKPATSMAVEFVKKAKEKIKEIKKENLKEENKKGEKEESITLTDKDFEAYLKSLDYAIKNLDEESKKLEKKAKEGNLGTMDLLSFSLNAMANVFNPDQYLDQLSDNPDEKEHFQNAFGKIVMLYSYIKDKPVDQYIKECKENIEQAKKNAEEMKKKMEELKKQNPELAEKLQGEIDVDAMKEITEKVNPLSMFSENDFSLYSKFQKQICEKNDKLREELKKLRKIFENFQKQ